MPSRPHDPDEPEPARPGAARPGDGRGPDDEGAPEHGAGHGAQHGADREEGLGDDLDDGLDDDLGAGLDDGDHGRATDLDEAEVAARWAGIVSELAGASDPRSWSPDPAAEEAEDHFTPPDPGPVLGGDPLLTMAWCAVAGVPILLMVAVVAWRDMPTWLLQAAAVAFLAGVGLLLWRMPRDREHDDGPGAVV
jgi:hypothetical protein